MISITLLFAIQYLALVANAFKQMDFQLGFGYLLHHAVMSLVGMYFVLFVVLSFTYHSVIVLY